MQRLAFILLIFSAAISGMMVPFAQRAAAMPATVSVHRMDQADCAGQPATGSIHHGTEAGSDCHHGSKPIHPMLCAACFAIVAEALPLPGRDARGGLLVASSHPALADRAPQPQSPPPKAPPL